MSVELPGTRTGRLAASREAIGATPAFHLGFALLAVWPASGAYLDAWAHRHLPGLETFFTPWHAVLYSGIFVPTAVLGLVFIRNQSLGIPWRRAVPAGYGLSLIGGILFAFGGLLDLGWHLLFGIESNVAALLSPTHLLLMLSAGLIATGPLRAIGLGSSTRAPFAAVLSATLLLTALTFFAQFNNPLIDQWAAAPAPSRVPAPIAQEQGVLGVILYAGLLMGTIFLLLRRFSLPPGSLTLLFGLNAVFVTGLVGFDRIIAPSVFSGVVGDLMLWWLRPASGAAARLRLFAFAVPAFYFLVYFTGLWVADGIWWPIHLWLGSIVIAGVTGWLLSYLVVAPRSVSVAAPAA